ncbi:hypothetical protein LTS18_004370 [Coniosporium uncinatum]|uniref:Uncharacterized protein n=1 Tax=Coniosporium uncinatum TaxID=93489 RepID=A0ACC3DB82_9PEZI|nr:hypothetical protein LTS18_004370 [Coniosporium uncinatum]
MEAFQSAMTSRSLRTVRAELDFLSDSGVINQQQLSTILSQLPADGASRAASVAPTAAMNNLSIQSPPPQTSGYSAPSYNEKQNGYSSPNYNEKQNGYYNPPEQVSAPPPAYPATPAPPALAQASALYAYNPTDAGDLALLPNDRIAVSEYMNAEWWKGKNERTGLDGIFPRSYVKVVEDKAPVSAPSNYGNMPLDVASGSGTPNDPAKPNKGAEMGKKFGKKMGNAAIFGAGATIGSNIVNGIF